MVAPLKMVPLVRLWVLISAFASLAGWTLSALGQLNRPGYAVCFAAFAAFISLKWRDLGFATPRKFSRVKKFPRRFLRPWPFCFALLAALIFLGSVIQPSGNYTGMTYRVPRVLQWLAHGQWVWIHTPDYRMNDRACGIEWLSAPLLLFTGSLRGLFLLNFLPFLLLPGLVFSVFTRLGVRARAAWHWMWLLPAGYNFILQAGGTANDTFSAVYALAAVDFALRARKKNSFSDAAISVLAAALMTGGKASNLPLLLPWAILIFPCIPLQRGKMAATGLVALAALVVSYLPNALLNIHHCGDWTGAATENAVTTVGNPVVAVFGNVFQLFVDSFVPPFFPLAGWWSQHAPQFLPQALVDVARHFDYGFFWVGELPTEDWSGIGFGLDVLLVASVAAVCFGRLRGRPARTNFQRLVLWAPWVSLLAYCAKSGLTTPSRLIAPYYALLLPLLLVGDGQSQITRRRWWCRLAGLVMLLAFAVLVASPDRPLWPAKTILSKLASRHPDSHLVSRALGVYTVYSKRADPLAEVRALLPKEAEVVGFIGTADDCDISFWLPLGQRRVEHFLLDDPPVQIRQARVEYVVVSGELLQARGVKLENWLQTNNAGLVGTAAATLKVAAGSQAWFVARLRP